MLSLKSFIELIQEAVLNANEKLNDRNIEILKQYFEKEEEDARTKAAISGLIEITKKLDEFEDEPELAMIRKVSSDLKEVVKNYESEKEEESSRIKLDIPRLIEIIKELDEFREPPKLSIIRKISADIKEIINKYEADKEKVISLFGYLFKPKMFNINFPFLKQNGKVENKEVAVPLITLAPIDFLQIDKLKLNANLEFYVNDNNEIEIRFGTKKREGEENSTHFGNLEIVLRPQEKTSGLDELVLAYEKVLKSQLPG